MGDYYAEVDAAIIEIDHARKLLGRLKIRQIRNSEQRGFLRATSLSWFRNHRTIVALSIPNELLLEIDQKYQTILDATEKGSAKSTYDHACNSAKAALVKARSMILTTNPLRQSSDNPPDFGPLASDITMQEILTRRWDECCKCLNAGAPLATTVMMGGLLEALFVSRANKLSDKSKLFSSGAVPIDSKTKKPLDLRQWTLGPYIDVGHDLKWISQSAKDVAVILRDYRNYIHPEKERSHGIILSQDDAKMLWEVTKTLSRELLSMKGVT